MKLESTATILDFDPMHIRTEDGATHNIGEGVTLADQRKFRFARAGEALTAGNLSCSPAPVTALHTLAVLTGAINGQTITFTNGTTGTIDTADEASYFSEGYVCVSYGTGIGQTFKINTIDPVLTDAAGTIHLYDIIRTALDTTSKIDIVQNTYNGVLEGVVQTTTPAGVPLIAVTAAGDFGWLQTRGICAVLADATIAVGNTVVADASASGRIDIGSTTYGTFQATHAVGKAIVAGAQAYAHAVFLTIE